MHGLTEQPPLQTLALSAAMVECGGVIYLFVLLTIMFEGRKMCVCVCVCVCVRDSQFHHTCFALSISTSHNAFALLGEDEDDPDMWGELQAELHDLEIEDGEENLPANWEKELQEMLKVTDTQPDPDTT